MSNTKYDKAKYKLIMPEAPIRDGNLSLKAIGLLAYINTNRIFAKENHWNLYESQVVKHCKVDGRTSVHSAFKELENKGYLERKRCTNSKGRFIKGSNWIVHNFPHPNTRRTVLQKTCHTVNASHGKPVSNYYQQQPISKTTNIKNNSSSSVPYRKDDDDETGTKILSKSNSNKSKQAKKSSDKASRSSSKRIESIRHLWHNNGYSSQQIAKALMTAKTHHASSPTNYADSCLRQDTPQLTSLAPILLRDFVKTTCFNKYMANHLNVNENQLRAKCKPYIDNMLIRNNVTNMIDSGFKYVENAVIGMAGSIEGPISPADILQYISNKQLERCDIEAGIHIVINHFNAALDAQRKADASLPF